MPRARKKVIEDDDQPPDPAAPSLADRLWETAASMLAPRPEQLTGEVASAERSLYEFAKQAWHVLEPATTFVDGWHLGCMAEHFQAMTEGQIRNLIVNVPPRHCKSLMCVFWFCWEWLRMPASRWLVGTYGQNLAHRDSEKCLDVVQSAWYEQRWGHVFRVKKTNLEKITNDRQGYRIAATVQGKIMGEGGDCLLYDDPQKSQDAVHESKRVAVIESWSKAMSTRSNSPKTVRRCVIMQRLHERDLSGYLLAERGGFEHLCLPAEYEPSRYYFPDPGTALAPPPPGATHRARSDGLPRDAIVPTPLQLARPDLMDPRTEEGQPLWPGMYDEAAIEELKKDLEAVGAAGQLQQRPAPRSGSVFQDHLFRHFTLEDGPEGPRAVLGIDRDDGTEAPRLSLSDLRWFQCWDTATTTNKRSAYTAAGTFAWHRATRTLLVWHVWRAKLEVYEQAEALSQLRDGDAVWSQRTRTWAIPGNIRPWPKSLLYQAVEDKSSGTGLIAESRARGVPLLPLKASQDPIQRAAAVANMMRAGKVWFRAGAQWLIDLEDELLTFPSGAYADQATVLSYAGQQATTDSLLNAGVEGDLLCWPPAPVDARGIPISPENLLGYTAGKDVVTLGHKGSVVEVVFDDEEDAAW